MAEISDLEALCACVTHVQHAAALPEAQLCRFWQREGLSLLAPEGMVCTVQIVAYDFGIKHNILRRLASFGCKITVVPADYPASKVLDMSPDGIFLSNGPVSVLSLISCLWNDRGFCRYPCLRIHA